MVILKKEGLAFNVLNIILVAAVIYFTWLALNRWVLPFNAEASTGGAGAGTQRYKICKDAAGTNYQWFSNKPCPSIYV